MKDHSIADEQLHEVAGGASIFEPIDDPLTHSCPYFICIYCRSKLDAHTSDCCFHASGHNHCLTCKYYGNMGGNHRCVRHATMGM